MAHQGFRTQLFEVMLSNAQLLEYQEMDIMGAVFPTASEKTRNRLYLCWRNSKGVQCKMIGPETKCFCNHRFKEHEYLDPKAGKPFCKAIKCKCRCFDYIPTHGAYDFKCLCKHSYKQHDIKTRKCSRANCKNCDVFKSTWTCSCGAKFIDHRTVIETYEERKQGGKSVNDMFRLHAELNHGQEQGSLYKPIAVKQDPEARLKQRRQSSLLKYYPKVEGQDQEVEEYKPPDFEKYKQK